MSETPKESIVAGTWWTYVGPGDGRNLKHKVVSVDSDEVVTFSELNARKGFSWLGDKMEFLKHFKPA